MQVCITVQCIGDIADGGRPSTAHLLYAQSTNRHTNTNTNINDNTNHNYIHNTNTTNNINTLKESSRCGRDNHATPSPPTKSFPTKSPRVKLSGRLPIKL